MLLFLAACGRDIPKPESKMDILPFAAEAAVAIPVTNKVQTSGFYVRHHIKGKNLFVECMLSEISFRNDNGKKTGKLLLYVDGKKTEEIHTPVFIIKGLHSGNHRIKLEVVSLQNKPYSMKKEFNVTMP
jgi:hypothetical protein